MPNPFKLEFTLKQHTPIIHFQHDQRGATLRATEVKAKLDRFILEKVGEAECQKRGWFVGDGSQKALDYKLHFYIENDKLTEYWLPLSLATENFGSGPKENKVKFDQFIARNNPKLAVKFIQKSPFFANNPHFDQQNALKIDWDSMRYGIIAKSNIKGSVVCKYKALKNFIDDKLLLFFATNNFGTRQSKGFGSFSRIDRTDQRLRSSDYYDASKDILAVYKKLDDTRHFADKIEWVATIWRLMKAGNSHGEYLKADVMKYFCEKNIRWEKRAIKREIIEKHGNTIWPILNRKSDKIGDCGNREGFGDEKYEYVRALLGLAEHNEYGTRGDEKIKIKIQDALESKEETKSQSVQRFKSPVTFKINDSSIYMIVYKIPTELHTQKDGNRRKFNFLLEKGDKAYPDNKTNLLRSLEVPNLVSLEVFLDSEYIDKNNFITGKSVAEQHGFTKEPKQKK